MRFWCLLHTVYARTEGSDEPVYICNLYVQSYQTLSCSQTQTQIMMKPAVSSCKQNDAKPMLRVLT